MININSSSSTKKSGFFCLRSLGGGPAGDSGEVLCLRSDWLYTAGRAPRRCHVVLGGRAVSRRHCQLFLDGLDCRLWLVDGFFLPHGSDLGEIRRRLRSRCEGSGRRSSTNGVYVNGRRLKRGLITELYAGDEVLLGCRDGSACSRKTRCGFLVQKIVFSAAVENSDACKMLDEKPVMVSEGPVQCTVRHDKLVWSAALLLRHCRSILQADDPVSYLRTSLDLGDVPGIGMLERVTGKDLVAEIPVLGSEACSKIGAQQADDGHQVPGSATLDPNVVRKDKCGNFLASTRENDECSNYRSHFKKDVDIGCYSEGNTFFLNRLQFMDHDVPNQHDGVSLPELLHPIGTLIRVFIATFTSDIPWFLSYCRLPNHLPITIACHSSERCWSSSDESRTSVPYSNFPNLLLVYPPFPDVIAFGKDCKKKGIACHHPKLIVLQREDSMRVIVTSANLCSKQWNNVTNTVWWQDFPRRSVPEYSALFGTTEESTSDFAAQLAGFIASLITNVPNQAHWIMELAKYDFGRAVAHLVASAPGMHVKNPHYPVPDHFLSAKQTLHSQQSAWKFIGCVQASVVGLSHRFYMKTDSNGAQLKTLASFLRKCQMNTSGISEVLLKRNINIPADANAVSVLVADLDELSEGDYIQLGFLPRDVAKWVSPLSDIELFRFSAFIYPKEALAAALEGCNMKVQLILYVSQGPRFSEISKLIQPLHIAALCSLLASMQRCLGLWRLHEVLSRYKWPGSLETDFIYGSSSIGTSVNPQFLAAFSAAAGKRSFQFSESEESDPEWGCWNTNHELRNPSMKILFPTIQRVKNGVCGILPSRCLLSFSEKTWQKLRAAGIFHDAIPHPAYREGYPMHVKVARRRFQSKKGMQSFGWIYCGSHNFSPAAWGRVIDHSSEVPGTALTTVPGPRLHICNYELGILFIVPPSDHSTQVYGKRLNLDDVLLPFVMPAPKYQDHDRPATAQAMREALAEAAVLNRETSLATAAAVEDMNVDVPEEEEMLDETDYFVEEKEEEKVYAEMLWSQVDSSEN